MKKLLLVLFCVPLLLAATCEDDDDTVPCPIENVYGLYVEVVDAVTGENVPIVHVSIVEGDYSNTLNLEPGSDPPVYRGALERPGTYQLTVTKQGYQTHTAVVVLEQDRCGVVQQRLLVELSPE